MALLAELCRAAARTARVAACWAVPLLALPVSLLAELSRCCSIVASLLALAVSLLAAVVWLLDRCSLGYAAARSARVAAC